MASLHADNKLLTVMVSFDCEAQQQAELAEKIKAYVANFISQQDGFVSSHLHVSRCGKHVVNYAQWQSMEHFKAFGEKARSRPELPELLAFKPRAVFYDVAFSAE